MALLTYLIQIHPQPFHNFKSYENLPLLSENPDNHLYYIYTPREGWNQIGRPCVRQEGGGERDYYSDPALLLLAHLEEE